jgi:hypothetical protein
MIAILSILGGFVVGLWIGSIRKAHEKVPMRMSLNERMRDRITFSMVRRVDVYRDFIKITLAERDIPEHLIDAILDRLDAIAAESEAQK